MTRKSNDNEPTESAPARPGAPVDPYRVYRALWRGKWFILAAVLVGGVAGVMAGKQLFPPSYVASATLRYKPPGEEGRGAELKEISTFVESMSAAPAVSKFRERRGLPKHVDPTNWFQTEPDVYGGLLTISGGGPSPQAAADTVNDMIDATLEYRKELSQKGFQVDLEALEERLQVAKGRLSEAQARYDAFRREHGISDLSQEQQSVIAAAADARAAADAAAGTKALLESRLEELRKELAEAPSGGGSDMPAASSSQISRLRNELAQLRRALSDDHPQVQALREQLNRARATLSPRASIQQEMAKVQRQLDDATDEAERLQVQAQFARERASAASAVEGEASSLLAAVRVEERLMQELETERARLRNLLSRGSDDFRLLSPAVPPAYPEGNKLKKITMAGIPLLTMLLVMVVLLARELWGFRVRTAAEASFWGGGPVIGATTWPRDEHALESLVADLDDQLPQASGSMLVVGATDVEIPFGEEISRVLNEDWFSPALVDLEQPMSMGGDNLFERNESERPALLAAGGGGGGGSTALAHRPVSNRPLAAPMSHSPGLPSNGPPQSTAETSAWSEAPRGQALRRAARLADRVLVVVHADKTSFADVAATPTRLGRTDGVGYLVVGISDEFASLPDRVGDIESFFAAVRS